MKENLPAKDEVQNFNSLRDKWVQAQQTGDFAHISTSEMEELITYMVKAEDALLMFPECASTRFWCCMQRLPLEGYVRARKSKNEVRNE